MPKYLKVKNTHIDMTPFVDIVFLILTFFILVTNFKPQESIKITPPDSVSIEEIKEFNNSLTILFDSGENVFAFISKDLRIPFLNKFYEKYGISLNPAASKDFIKTGEINTALVSLNQYYSLPSESRKNNISGLDMSDKNQDLFEIISIVKNISDNSATYYLKGDNSSKYSVYKKILNALINNSIHNFSLITSTEPIPPGSPLGIKQSIFNKSNK